MTSPQNTRSRQRYRTAPSQLTSATQYSHDSVTHCTHRHDRTQSCSPHTLTLTLLITLLTLCLTIPLTHASALYSFTTHTFTSPLIGSTMPNNSFIRSYYITNGAANWVNNPNYFNMSDSGGPVQSWTVPLTGYYTFVIAGGSGGDGKRSGGSIQTGGSACGFTGLVLLQQSNQLLLMPGQRGSTPDTGLEGAGGGTSRTAHLADCLQRYYLIDVCRMSCFTDATLLSFCFRVCCAIRWWWFFCIPQ